MNEFENRKSLAELMALSQGALRPMGREAKRIGDPMFRDVSATYVSTLMLKDEMAKRLAGEWIIVDESTDEYDREREDAESEDYDATPKSEPARLPAPSHASSPSTGGDALLDLIANALKDKLGPVDLAKVWEALQATDDRITGRVNSLEERLDNNKQEIIIREIDKGREVQVGKQHRIFKHLLARLRHFNRHIMLVGPAGSGKTHICKSLAEALGIAYHFQSVGPETSKSDLMGHPYVNKEDGVYEPEFAKAYKYGGLCLLDEFDRGHHGVLTILNAPLDNGACTFPDGTFSMHPDFRLIVSANTFGRGRDQQYVGANTLDGATLERFGIFFMDYDRDLEMALCPNREWCKKIHKLRDVVAEHKAKVIVSMRPILYGAEFLSDIEDEADEEELLDQLVWKGYNADAKEAMMADWRKRI